MLRFSIAAVAMTSAPIALAAQQAPADAVAEAAPPPASQKVCKVQREIGSRLGGVKKCRTKQEWDELQRETRTSIDKVQIQGASVCFPGVKGCNE